MAQAKGKIVETQLQIIQIDQDLASEVAKELREIDAKVGEFIERQVTAEDNSSASKSAPPLDGLVHQLTVHTVGGVIAPGEPVMLVVPETETPIVEARVAPQDIDQLQVGQPAVLRFSAFNQRTTPEIIGTVIRVSADITTDTRTGLSYYTARIAMSPEEIARLGDVRLLPGMPRGSLHADRRQNHDLLSAQAAARPVRSGFPRAIGAEDGLRSPWTPRQDRVESSSGQGRFSLHLQAPSPISPSISHADMSDLQGRPVEPSGSQPSAAA